MTEKRIVKILCECTEQKCWLTIVHSCLYIDVDEDLDERRASAMLEEVTRPLGIVCIFNVCQSTLTGLELTEIVDYDLVFVTDSKNQPIPCHSFLRILRNILCNIPIVLLVSNDSSSAAKISPHPFPSNSFNYDASLEFNARLNRPYAKSEFNQLITDMLTFGSDGRNMVPMEVDASNQYLVSSLPSQSNPHARATSNILQMAKYEDMTQTPSRSGIAMRDDDGTTPPPAHPYRNPSTVSPVIDQSQATPPRWIPSIPSATLQYNQCR